MRLLLTPTSFSAFSACFRAVGSEVLSAIFFGIMTALVLSTGHHFKVLNAIVTLVAIDVMDYFVRLQISPIGLLPHIAMLAHVTVSVGCWMIWHEHLDITVAVGSAPTFPTRRILSQSSYGMAGQERHRMAAKPSPAARGYFGYWSLLSASALTNARRYLFRLWVIDMSRATINLAVVARQKARWRVFVNPFRRDRCAASAFAKFDFHGGYCSHYYLGCLA